MKSPILKYAGLNALGTTLYVACIASLIFYAPVFFGSDTEDNVFMPIAMLLLLIVSASVTGSLVLGRPILWYLDGKKKEAVSLLMATLGFLALFTFIAFLGIGLLAR